MKIVYNGEMDGRMFKDVIGQTLEKMVNEDENVVYLDADLQNCISTGKWAKGCDRAIDCGIAEANMVGVACGMSAVGFKPYVHTFGPFASRRCYDQIFLSGGYAKNDITVIGTDPGVTAAFNGGTHMPFEDVALYRALPEAKVIDITDHNMLIDILTQCKDIPGVKYIRVGRKGAAKVYEDGSKFEIGKGIVLKDGKDAAIIACGIMVNEAMKAAEELAKDGIDAAVIDMFTIKPLDEELVKKYAEKTGAVITAENHNKIGGLRSAVCETLAGSGAKIGYVAVEDVFGEVGPQDYLQKQFGLTAEHIVSEVKKTVASK